MIEARHYMTRKLSLSIRSSNPRPGPSSGLATGTLPEIHRESLADLQNQPSIQKLFAAQRVIYAEAKTIHNARHISAIVLAGLAPLVLWAWPSSATVLALIGGAAALFLEGALFQLERSKVKSAATIQEQLDTDLFYLPWNQTLVGQRIPPEDIASANRRFRGKRDDFLDWYADPAPLPYPLNVLVCQRANLTWDSRLRRNYGFRVLVLTILIVLLGIGLGIGANLSFIDYLLGIFLPSLPAVLQGIRLQKDHFGTANEKDRVRDELGRLINETHRDSNSLTRSDCRAIQDRIYSLRADGPLVPEWWYQRLRSSYEIDMTEAVEQLKRDMLHSIDLGRRN